MFIKGLTKEAMTEIADKPRYRINAVSKKTGIIPVTLRAWERRYQVLTPNREENTYRLYSDQDIEILRWLKTQVDSGISISQAAAELKDNQAAGITIEPRPDVEKPVLRVDDHGTKLLAGELYTMLVAHNEIGAAAIFEQAAASLPLNELLEKIIIPVLVRVGEEWYLGRILVATEHFASNFLHARLMKIFLKIPLRRGTKRLLVGGAPGEMHELGILMMSILLREAGYQVEFLGPDMPLDDLVDYAAEVNTHMVILSATTREAAEELTRFRHKLERLKKPPLFGFGGGAYAYFPEMIAATPGIFLGKTLSDSVVTVNTCFQPG